MVGDLVAILVGEFVLGLVGDRVPRSSVTFMVLLNVGALVGAFVGTLVGDNGILVGARLTKVVVGEIVGVLVGAAIMRSGCRLNSVKVKYTPFSLNVGDVLGERVGDSDGECEGLLLGEKVGCEVEGDLVGDEVEGDCDGWGRVGSSVGTGTVGGCGETAGRLVGYRVGNRVEG